MIDLVKFYKERCSGHYDRFAGLMVDFEYKLATPQDVVEAFRNICKPPETDYPDDNPAFILLCFWLYKNGYSIKEFPNVLSRPSSLSDFAYGDIRKHLMRRDGFQGTVPWSARRMLCDEMTIASNASFQDIPDEIEETIALISTRGAKFDSMASDEKLALLNNLLENLLKRGRKYVGLDYAAVFFGSFSEEQVKEYRQKTHCFRHGDAEAIEARKSVSVAEKAYLADLGIFLVVHLHRYLVRA